MPSHLLPESLYVHSTKENLFEHLLCANRGDSKMYKQRCPKSDHPAVELFSQCLGEGPRIFVGFLVTMTSCLCGLSLSRVETQRHGWEKPKIWSRKPWAGIRVEFQHQLSDSVTQPVCIECHIWVPGIPDSRGLRMEQTSDWLEIS